MRVQTGSMAASTTVSVCRAPICAAAGQVTTSATTRGAALVSDCLPPWPLFICFPFPLSSCLFLSAIALLVSPVIDYCSFGNHSCQHECVSIPNGHYCRCRSGFTLQPDGKSCRGRSWCLCVQHVPLCPAQSPGKSCPKPPQMGITPCPRLVFQPPTSAMGWIMAVSSSV